MKKRICLLLAAIGVLLIMTNPVKAAALSDTISDMEQEMNETVIQSESESIERESESLSSEFEKETESETTDTSDETAAPALERLLVVDNSLYQIGEVEFHESNGRFGTLWSEVYLQPFAEGTISINGEQIQSGKCYGPINLMDHTDHIIDITVSDGTQTTSYTLTLYGYYINSETVVQFIYWCKGDNDYNDYYIVITEDTISLAPGPDPDHYEYYPLEWLHGAKGYYGYEYVNPAPGDIYYFPVYEDEDHRLYTTANDLTIEVKMINNQKPQDFSIQLFYTENGKLLPESITYVYNEPGGTELYRVPEPEGYEIDLDALGLNESDVFYRSLFGLEFDIEQNTWRSSDETYVLPVKKIDNGDTKESKTSVPDTTKKTPSKTNTKTGSSSKSGRTPATDDSFPIMPYILLLIGTGSILCIAVRKHHQ